MGFARNKRNQDLITLRFPFPAQGKRATGSIVCATNANMADSDFITISDGINAPVLYEYDKSANGVTAGRVAVTAGGGTAAQTAANFKTAINANQPLLDVTDNLDGSLTLESKLPGTFANVSITENVAHASFTVSGMTGGLDTDRVQADIATIPYWTAEADFEVFDAKIYTRDGLANSASAFAVIALKKGATVIADWSTETGQEGTLTAGAVQDLTMATLVADRRGAAGDTLSLGIDVTLTPKVPQGYVEVHLRYRGPVRA
jgi:hypothetical protein